MTPHETLEYFKKREGEMIDAIREIVEIESPSYDVERSKTVVLWIENEARKIGLDLEVERIAGEGYGEHLIIRAFPGEEKPTLLLGHSDTVHPVGTKEQNPTRIDGDKFYGCGIFDMKANIVLMVEALRYLKEEGIEPSRPITVFLSCDEEVGSHSGRAILEREAAKDELETGHGRCFITGSGRDREDCSSYARPRVSAYGRRANRAIGTPVRARGLDASRAPVSSTLLPEARTIPPGHVSLEITDAVEPAAAQYRACHPRPRPMAAVHDERRVRWRRDAGDPAGETPERDVKRARDVAALELRARPHVQDHRRRSVLDRGGERLRADRLLRLPCAIRRHLPHSSAP